MLSAYEVTTPVAESGSAATPEEQTANAKRVTNIPGLPPSYDEAPYGKVTYGFDVPENYDPAPSYKGTRATGISRAMRYLRRKETDG